MHTPERRAALGGLGLLLVAATGAVATPRRRLADELPPLNLEVAVPREFGNWRIDQNIAPVLPTPDVQERLDKLYSRIFSRTFVDVDGNQIMFLIAYGADQADRMTLAHLPEACYSSQGFDVSPTTVATVHAQDRSIRVVRLRTQRGARVEPVTYWTTVGDQAVVDEVSRRWVRAQYSLLGIIPDGMLVRVSSIGTNEALQFDLHSNFVGQLYADLSSATRLRLFGLPA